MMLRGTARFCMAPCRARSCRPTWAAHSMIIEWAVTPGKRATGYARMVTPASLTGVAWFLLALLGARKAKRRGQRGARTRSPERRAMRVSNFLKCVSIERAGQQVISLQPPVRSHVTQFQSLKTITLHPVDHLCCLGTSGFVA